MTPLSQHIAQLILTQGPISLSHYMALALGHPRHGYYMQQSPFGIRGDFITAPEISQMFGELIGIWCADMWSRMGSPPEFAWVELGPGRGTLMQDALRALAVIPGFTKAAQVHFVETSPALRKEQSRRVPHATWHSSLETVPDMPFLLVANEFFDALPVQHFQRTPEGWCEVQLTVDESKPDDIRFIPHLSPVPRAGKDWLPDALAEAPEGSIVEICSAGLAIANLIGRKLSMNTGAALIIDYGHSQSAPGETLQAVHAHGYTDPFVNPGASDLTAHVDFSALAQAAEHGGARIWPLSSQTAFLKMLGIDIRARKLAAGASPAGSRDVRQALHRLTHEDEMGTLFKVLTLTGPTDPAPAGFAPS